MTDTARNFAVGYVLWRPRAHERAHAGGLINSFWPPAVLGAVISAVFSFVPFSSVLGGSVAGYVELGESERTVSVGALAGLLPLLPALVLVLFVLGGLTTGLLAIGQTGMAIFLGVTILLVMIVAAIIGAGLGALRVYVGGRFAEGRADSN